MLAAKKPPLAEAYLEHISMKPWSSYTEADYTPAQWHQSCLIHQHEGEPTSKSQCKLPVRTPNGAINRNGVHAATAALHGARASLDATEEQKDKARQALIRLYGELGETPPGSLNHAEDDEDALIHFGVKGMKWGVRNEEGSKGKKSSTKEDAKGKAGNPYALTDDDRAVLKAAGVKPSDSQAMKDKYGPGTLGKEPKKEGRLSNEQKEVVKNLLIVGGAAAGAWYLYHRMNKAIENDYFNQINPVQRSANASQRDMAGFRKEWFSYVEKASSRERGGYTKDMIDKLSDEGTELKAGAVFRRISTERETTIRAGGFYASHKDEDVNRYKAILPIYWKMWGKSASSGQIVSLRANADVKAPSPKKTYEMFRGMLNDEIDAPNLGGKKRLRDFFVGGHGPDDDAVARKIFPQFSAAWNNDNHPPTRHFFSRLKGDGYNAVVDMNDAGTLSSRPMRLLDGTMFEISGHETLSSSAIATAQENIKSIAHAAMLIIGALTVAGEEYFAHAGVKGMKWGVRKPEERADPNRQRRNNELLVKSAMAVGAVAVGAILLRRGGVKLSTPASRRIALGGAKMSLRILQKSGRIMATTSVKIGQTVGKTAVKGTTKAVTLVGKGSYRGAIAGSKAAGRAIAQNGSKFYTNVVKKSALSTVKLGSHAMYKLTGRGTPIVNDVARRSVNLSPTDLLLNVRSDSWGGRR